MEWNLIESQNVIKSKKIMKIKSNLIKSKNPMEFDKIGKMQLMKMAWNFIKAQKRHKIT